MKEKATDQIAEKVELEDVQGIIIKGYSRLEAAKYVLLKIKDFAKTKQWIAEQIPSITLASVSTKNISTAFNLALTYSAIKKLGAAADTLNTFPPEFIEGIVSEHRTRMLGDTFDSAPDKWEWGGTAETNTFDILLLLFAKDEIKMQEFYNDQQKKWEAGGLELMYKLDTTLLPNGKEHFGFRDGIAEPVIKNINHDADSEDNMINPGEFLFGYINEYEQYMFSPTVNPEKDPQNLLASDKNNATLKDLGRNGSMLVFRHLEQNVKAFWNKVSEAATEQTNQNNPVSAEHVAAKMIGRWPNGSPLTKCPIQPEDSKATLDNFGYAREDFDGLKCPIGAHIRRTNQRDNFLRNSSGDLEKDIEKSIKFTKRFRIIRRGRYYGKPLAPSMEPKDIMTANDDGEKRGLYFLCFNSNIARQFELVQQTWVNNPKFAGLYDDPDPIIGDPSICENATTTFTIQAEPVRHKITGLTRFVNVKGGAYFFMPGIKALNYLSTI